MEPIHHPPAQRGSRATIMGENMTQNGAKNSQKQTKITKTAFDSFHQYTNYNHHNVNLHIVFEYFFSPQILMV
jgi:hypothetical protein